MHVSITGLRLRHPVFAPVFWWHAVRSMAQAQAAEGNLSVASRRIAGVHYTMSLWRDRAAMLVYMRRGAHRQAMAASTRIATGQVAGFPVLALPDWTDVPDLLNGKGRSVA